MSRMSKSLSLILILIIALSSLIMVGAAFAQSTAKQSVSEFAVRYVDRSYDVATTYGVDSYTGKTVIIQEGYHIQNNSIIITIKNQPFARYSDSNGNSVGFYYNISSKGHFGSDWTYYNNYINFYLNYNTVSYFESSYDSNTVVVFGLTGNNGSEHFGVNLGKVTDGGQIDFRVQAYTAYFTEVKNQMAPIPGWKPYTTVLNLVGVSDWSDTQTITLTDGATSVSISTSPYPTPTATVPEFPIMVMLPLFAATSLIVTKLFQRKQLSKSL